MIFLILFSTFAGILRHVIVIEFKEKYFKKAWSQTWDAWDPGSIETLKEYGIDNKKFEKYLKPARE